MLNNIIATIIIMLSVEGIIVSLSFLVGKLKEPKETRIWWGLDILMQLAYPIYIFGIIIGIHNLIH